MKVKLTATFDFVEFIDRENGYEELDQVELALIAKEITYYLEDYEDSLVGISIRDVKCQIEAEGE